MTTHDDIRRIVGQLPGAVEGDEERFGFSVPVKGKHKGFVWTWAERVEPKKPKVINNRVIAVSVPNLMVKEALIAENSEAFFDEDHYRNYPAILVRLDFITPDELEPLLVEAWKNKAPKDLLAMWTESGGSEER